DGDVVIKLAFVLKWRIHYGFDNTITPRPADGTLQKAINVFLPSREQAAEAATEWSPRDFYKSAFVPDKDDRDALAIEIPGLNAELYPFQKRALKWLLAREGVRWS